jgi:hypothetical protein
MRHPSPASSVILGVVALAGSFGLTAAARGQTCTPDWVPTFGHEAGMNDTVQTLQVLAVDGAPALYAGGSFTGAGDMQASRVARWDGSAWSALGPGLDSSVRALAAFDDGSGGGSELYAGGSFIMAGGTQVNSVARWDGSAWSGLAGGVRGTSPTVVRALTVFDDGSGGGPALYVAGRFSKAGGIPVSNIARWDGSAWSALGTGLDNEVTSLVVFDDGSGGGPALHAAGSFQFAGATPIARVARWNGSTWSPLGAGIGGSGFFDKVETLVTFDDGSGAGTALYAGGDFSEAGGGVANGIARWDGAAWTTLGSGTTSEISVLSVFDDGQGGGPVLHAGGSFTSIGGVSANRIARWTGSAWAALGSNGLQGVVRTLAAFGTDGVGEPLLYAGGGFDSSGSVPVHRIARWSGSTSTWLPLGDSLDQSVDAFAVLGTGRGSPALIVGGQFKAVGDQPLNSVAQWDGSSLSALGSGMDGEVMSLAAFDDGPGDPELYAGGFFSVAGGVAANNVARWDGAQWSALGSGMAGFFHFVAALVVFDDGSGSGPALHAGGRFSSAGGAIANNVAKWNGASWQALGDGVDGIVHAMAVFDDGTGDGPALYAAGSGGLGGPSIAKWNGTTWAPVGGGVLGLVISELVVWDDGSGGGPALYAGGMISSANGEPAQGVARWDGQSWSAPGVGPGFSVMALAVFDDGSGEGSALYAGGSFTAVGGLPADRLAKWDGASWSEVGGGVSDTVAALGVFDDGSGSGPALYVGGDFTKIGGSGDSHLAKWGCTETSPWTDLGFALAGASGFPVLSGTGTLQAGTPVTVELQAAAPSALATLFGSVASVPQPFKGGTLVPVPPLIARLLMTDAAGGIALAFAEWPAGLSGLTLDLQYAIQDAGAIQGVALSNALSADVP